MNQPPLEKIKNMHWTLDWSGNWPLLDAMMQRDANYERESKKISGVILLTGDVGINEDRVSTRYRTEECFEEQQKYFLGKFKSDPAFLKRSARWYRFRVNRDLRALRKILGIKNLSKLSNEKIASLFTKARGHFSYNATVDIYDWYMERIFTPLLAEYLEKKLTELGKVDHITEYVNTLIIPHKISVIFRERTEFFAIITYIRNRKELETRIKRDATFTEATSEEPRLIKMAHAYFKKYVWMPVLVNNPPHTLETVWEEIVTFIKTDAPLEIKTKRLGDNYDTKAIARSFEYIRELKPPKEILHMIEGLRGMAFMRTEDYVVMSESAYCVIPLYTEVGRRLGISYKDLKELLPEEVLSHLKTATKVDPQFLAKRTRFNCHITLGNEFWFFEEDDARLVKDAIDQQMRTAAGTGNEFKGVIGNKGKVIGRARVALTYASVSEVRSDEILILASVSASFVPHLGKAAGLVAEFGGLTSHPIIVAREFNLPCVVGIKGITSRIKDGDMIELDADTGIVKKL